MPSPERQGQGQGIEWTLSELGNPILANATAVIECELWREYEGGDHAIMVGKVKNLIVRSSTPGRWCAAARWAPCPLA
jgi:flavin reductase (DIM6/NTAB) family NADH-FMN oxidoreductase RutF